jgi:hypothetical protein
MRMNGLSETVVPCPIDLFGNPPGERTRAPHRRQPLELKVAGALCRQLRRKSARHEKQRIAHLICLNLVSLLKSRTGR